MPGPQKSRHNLIDGEDYVGDIAATDATRSFLKDPATVISNAVREGIVAANEQIYETVRRGTKDELAANNEHFRELAREGSAGAYRTRNL